MKKMQDVIIADFDNWTIMVVSKDGEIPAQCQHYIRYVWIYLMYGRGLFKNRFTSVATRLFTRTLKPSQNTFLHRLWVQPTKEEAERNKPIFARYNEIKDSLGKDDDVYEILKSEFNLNSRKEAFEIVLMELGDELDEMFRHNKSGNL